MVTSKNCIIRLSQYKNALCRFQRLGFVKIFSDYLADAVGVTSTQVRKDFSLFSLSGNKRGGYQIDALLEKLNEILGKNEIQKVALVGVGNLGAALLRYTGFERERIKVCAAFEIDPSKINPKAAIPILPVTEIEAFCKSHSIKIGIICVPEIGAQQVMDSLAKAGIKGVLNFAPVCLKTPDDCTVSNVNLEIELENLIYFANAMQHAAHT
jgi:redox-sensing transcriptional repressor